MLLFEILLKSEMRLVQNKKMITVALVASLQMAVSVSENERDLQSISNSSSRVRITQPLTSYPEDLQIPFSATLRCGACIRGGYVYCVNGYEEDMDLATKPAICC